MINDRTDLAMEAFDGQGQSTLPGVDVNRWETGGVTLTEVGAMVLPMTFFMGALLFSDICKQRGIAVRKIILRQDAWFRWLVFALSTAIVLLFGVWGPGFSEANFIYFQF